MELTPENLKHLANFLSQTLLPDPAVRKQAESQLSAAKVQSGYSALLLHLVVQGDVPAEIRLQAAIQFKNLINQHWEANENSDFQLSEADKAAVKGSIVGAMMSVPEKLQGFVSEALGTISNADFPLDQKWPQLVPQLMQTLTSSDPNIVIATLRTTHAITRKYRTASQTELLWNEILFMLKNTHDGLLGTMTSCLVLVPQSAGSKPQLDAIFQTLELIAKIYYDLNFQDIPEVFEDHLDQWMDGFHQLLTLPENISAVFAKGDDEKLSTMHAMQRSICEAILLYADKYMVVVDDSNRSSRSDERPVFQKHLGTFVQDVWGLLTKLGVQPQFDRLAVSAIRFLSSVLKGTHFSFFQPAHLQSIVESVVVPGLRIRESDEEDFEDNPLEYMQRDLEGGVVDTRRGVTCDLVNAMCVHFEVPTAQLCLAQCEALLGRYQGNQSDWQSKDQALYLFLALAIKSQTKSGGVIETNPQVNVLQFFERHVLADLQNVTAANVAKNPILMADLLKFLLTFRNQIPKEAYGVLFPILNILLSSQDCIVHTYAACCIERFLTVKDGAVSRVGRVELQPMLQPFLVNLFNCLNLETSKENPHIMKCVMRIVCVAQADIAAVASLLVGKLTEFLSELCKGFQHGRAPKNPAFHHYIFESLAAVVRHIAADPVAVTSMEEFTIPPFQMVLQADITEFQPYYIQIVAQILERRSGPMPPVYLQLLPSLLMQPLWASRSNQPPLARLIKAYISCASAEIIANQALFHQILGLVQFLLMSKMTDHYAFSLLNSIICHVPAAKFPEFLPVLITLSLDRFQKLPQSSNSKFLRCLIVFFSLYIAKHGPEVFLTLMEGVQAGMMEQFLTFVWVPKLNVVVSDSTDRKIAQVGLTRLLCESPRALNYGCWPNALDAVCKSVKEGKAHAGGGLMNVVDEDLDFEFLMSYNNSSFLALHNAAQDKASLDPLPDIADSGRFVVESLKAAASRAPQIAPQIQAAAATYGLA
mmetsp:Transcript_82019/g.220246  ORF Transcript_82019/g.220246 Transcript_82019/m.220246 type:complete len:988 (-) Transcript_82019:468-3431(-)